MLDIGIQEIKEAFGKLTVMVVGDMRLDVNSIGGYHGQSREMEGHPVFAVDRVTYNPGGAANLTAQLSSLGVFSKALGLYGDDIGGDCLIEELVHIDAALDMVLCRDGSTGTFGKAYYESGIHAPIRMDVRASMPIEQQLMHLQSIIEKANLPDVLLVADYDEQGRGIVDALLPFLRELDTIKIGMSRNDVLKFQGFDLIICDSVEAMSHTGWDTVEDAGKYLTKVASEAVITMQGEGAIHFNRTEDPILRCATTPLVNPVDTCGAGDAFAAGYIAARYGAKLGSFMSMAIANSAARIMCGFKYGVGGYLDIESVIAEYRLLYETLKVELNLEHLQVERVDSDHIWGREFWLVNCKDGDYGAKVLEFESGYRGSVHSHERKDETLCPLNGEIVIELEDTDGLREHRLSQGTPLRVEAGRQHRITNTCGETVYIHETSKFEDEQTQKYQEAYELKVT